MQLFTLLGCAALVAGLPHPVNNPPGTPISNNNDITTTTTTTNNNNVDTKVAGIHSWNYDAAPPTKRNLVADATSIFTEFTSSLSNPKCKPTNIDQFVAAVKQGYDTYKAPYHNFNHGVSVLQFCYKTLRTLRTQGIPLEECDQAALLYACFGHDIAHPGRGNGFVNESYQKKSPLTSSIIQAVDKGSSVLEKWHAKKTLEILKNPATSPIKGVTGEELTSMLSLVESTIMATDLAGHTKLLEAVETALGKGDVKQAFKDHKGTLFGLIMSMADLSNGLRGKGVALKWNCEFLWEVDAEVKERQALAMPAHFLKKPTSVEEFKEQEPGFVKSNVLKTATLLQRVLGNAKEDGKSLVDRINEYIQALETITENDMKCIVTPRNN